MSFFDKHRFFLDWIEGGRQKYLEGKNPHDRRDLATKLHLLGMKGGNPERALMNDEFFSQEVTDQNLDSLYVLLIATFMLCVIAIGFFANIETTPRPAVHVMGVVMHTETRVIRARDRQFRFVEYEFGGETYQVMDPSPSRFDFRTGKQLRVSFNPDTPEDAVLTNTAAFYLNRVLAGVLGIFGLVAGFALSGNLGLVALSRSVARNIN